MRACGTTGTIHRRAGALRDPGTGLCPDRQHHVRRARSPPDLALTARWIRANPTVDASRAASIRFRALDARCQPDTGRLAAVVVQSVQGESGSLPQRFMDEETTRPQLVEAGEGDDGSAPEVRSDEHSRRSRPDELATRVAGWLVGVDAAQGGTRVPVADGRGRRSLSARLREGLRRFQPHLRTSARSKSRRAACGVGLLRGTQAAWSGDAAGTGGIPERGVTDGRTRLVRENGQRRSDREGPA